MLQILSVPVQRLNHFDVYVGFPSTGRLTATGREREKDDTQEDTQTLGEIILTPRCTTAKREPGRWIRRCVAAHYC